MWSNTQQPKLHLCKVHRLADSQSVVTQLSNNTLTKSPGGLSAGLIASKEGDTLHRAWINLGFDCCYINMMNVRVKKERNTIIGLLLCNK